MIISNQLTQDLDDPGNRNTLVRRFGLPGQFQYLYDFPTRPLSSTLLSHIQPWRGVRVCAPCDRFALYLSKLHGAPSGVIAQFNMEIFAGYECITEMVFQGTSNLTSLQDNGLLVIVSGFPATGWDVWLQLQSASPADNYEVSLGLILDHGKGPFDTEVGSLML